VKALALALIVLVAGCSRGEEARPGVDRICGPDVEGVPCGTGVEQGAAYRFELLVHCGIEWAYFDGRYWVAASRIDPPADWNPIESGTMTLLGEEAVFEGNPGGEARFAPAPVGYEPTPCA
jgi:hypothetical protein